MRDYNERFIMRDYIRRGSNVAPQSMLSSSLIVRSKTPTFNFKDYCFLCVIILLLNLWINRKKFLCHNGVYQTQKLSMKDTFLKAAENCDYEWVQGIIERIYHVIDLVVVDTKYHLFYYKKLYQYHRREKRGY